MNDRIRQLLEQAGVTYAVMPKDTVYEKFAALIIKECAGLAEDGFDDELDGQEICDSIKQHFGV